MGRRRRRAAAVRGRGLGIGRGPGARGDRGHAPVGSAVGGAHRSASRRPLRPSRLRPRRRRRDAVLEPRGPRRRDGRGGAGAGGARRVLAGGLDRHRHGARIPGSRVGPRLGLRRDQRLPRARTRPWSRPTFEKGEALEEAKDWAAAAEHDVEIWVDGFGQPRGPGARGGARRGADGWPTRRTSRRSRTATPIVLDPPAIGRLGEIRVPTLVIVGGARRVGHGRERRRHRAGTVPGARRIDLPDVAHMPSLERPEWFNETLLAFLARGRLALQPDDSRRRCGAPGDGPLDEDADQRAAVGSHGPRTADTSCEGRPPLPRARALEGRRDRQGHRRAPSPASPNPRPTGRPAA